MTAKVTPSRAPGSDEPTRTPAPHPDLKVEWIEKKGYVISLCQFCTKISPTSDTHPLPCPWLMYTTIESVVVACAHFKMLDCMLNTSASSDVLDEYTGIRPEVMRFAAAMELVLRKNDYKGGWREMGSYKLLERAYEELEECRREMRESKSGCMRRASREMVDAAAFCMMFFDNLYSMPINDEYLENKLKELRQEPEKKLSDTLPDECEDCIYWQRAFGEKCSRHPEKPCLLNRNPLPQPEKQP